MMIKSKILEPVYEKNYRSGICASIDWVAGGNYDGYIYEKSLIFIRESKKVIMKTKILDDSRYDGVINDGEVVGSYSFTDHNTITCYFGEIRMRGKVLGINNEYIAFSIFHQRISYPMKESYGLIN